MNKVIRKKRVRQMHSFYITKAITDCKIFKAAFFKLKDLHKKKLKMVYRM